MNAHHETAVFYLDRYRDMIARLADLYDLDADDAFQDCFELLVERVLPGLPGKGIEPGSGREAGYVCCTIKAQMAHRRVGVIRDRYSCRNYGPGRPKPPLFKSLEGGPFAERLPAAPLILLEDQGSTIVEQLYAALERLPESMRAEVKRYWTLPEYAPGGPPIGTPGVRAANSRRARAIAHLRQDARLRELVQA